MKNHNLLPRNVTDYFITIFKHYLAFNKIKDYDLHLNSIWVNEMKQHEYNPAHVLRGVLFTGLSSVMILKMPSSLSISSKVAKSAKSFKVTIFSLAN